MVNQHQKIFLPVSYNVIWTDLYEFVMLARLRSKKYYLLGCICDMHVQGILLRNKFHFSEVHGSMNAMGNVQSE